jgi:hypothetical protein
MSDTWNNLVEEVKTVRTVIGSATIAIRGWRQRLEEIVDAPTSEQVQALINELHDGEVELATAIADGTTAKAEVPAT